MSDKTTNKVARASVRLTNRQQYMLGQISNQYQIKQSTLIRFAIDNLILMFEQQQDEELGQIQDKVGEHQES